MKLDTEVQGFGLDELAEKARVLQAAAVTQGSSFDNVFTLHALSCYKDCLHAPVYASAR